MLDVMPVAFPWVRFLPREDVREFAVELVETLRAAEPLSRPLPMSGSPLSNYATSRIHFHP
jgi:hypothetical protein